jgi:hypothetical protein
MREGRYRYASVEIQADFNSLEVALQRRERRFLLDLVYCEQLLVIARIKPPHNKSIVR